MIKPAKDDKDAPTRAARIPTYQQRVAKRLGIFDGEPIVGMYGVGQCKRCGREFTKEDYQAKYCGDLCRRVAMRAAKGAYNCRLKIRRARLGKRA